MLQKNKAACAEGEMKVAQLKGEYTKLTKIMKTLEQELRLWKGKNSDLRFKLNYAMQVKL